MCHQLMCLTLIICCASLLITRIAAICTSDIHLEQHKSKWLMNNITRLEPLYQVSLHDDAGDYFCGGSIVAPRWILTAAHCLIMYERYLPENLSQAHIRYGTAHRQSGGFMAQPNRLLLHPNYTNDALADIALIETVSELNLSPESGARIVKLPMRRIRSINSMILVAGWGRTTPDEGKSARKISTLGLVYPDGSPDLLQAAWLPVVPCKFFNFSHIFCAGEADINICKGDSGSGAVNPKGQLVGIVRGGKGCCVKAFNSFFVNVSVYLRWIRSHIRDRTIKIAANNAGNTIFPYRTIIIWIVLGAVLCL